MRWFIAPFIALLSVGCSSAESDIIVIDSRFELDHQSAILLSLDEWFTAIPELRRPVEISNTDEPTIAMVKGQSPQDSEEYTTLGKAFPGGHVRIWPDMMSDDHDKFRAVALHEIGHFLGVLGHVEDGQIMYPHYDPDRPVCISQADIDELCEQRGGCQYATHPTCD